MLKALSLDMPIFLSPCAMQRLYHHDGDKASAKAADKFGTFIVCLQWTIEEDYLYWL